MENLKQQLKELKNKVAKLEKAIEEKENGDWKPEVGDCYYFISEDLKISQARNINDDYAYVRIMKRNTYRTEEEAQLALDMYNFCKERSFTPDWEDEEQGKSFICLYYGEREAAALQTFTANSFDPFYYPSREVAQEVIDKYSFEELEKYYGRV